MVCPCWRVWHQQINCAIYMHTAMNRASSAFFQPRACEVAPNFPTTKYSCQWHPRKVVQERRAINIETSKEWFTTATTREYKASKSFLLIKAINNTCCFRANFGIPIQLQISKLYSGIARWAKCSIRIWLVYPKIVTSFDTNTNSIKILLISTVKDGKNVK